MNITMKRGSFGLSGGSQGQVGRSEQHLLRQGDVFVIYDEDANGNRVPGTERYGSRSPPGSSWAETFRVHLGRHWR